MPVPLPLLELRESAELLGELLEQAPEKRVKRYAYDPHIDPALEFDPQGAEVERIIDRGPGGGTGVTQ